MVGDALGEGLDGEEGGKEFEGIDVVNFFMGPVVLGELGVVDGV